MYAFLRFRAFANVMALFVTVVAQRFAGFCRCIRRYRHQSLGGIASRRSASVSVCNAVTVSCSSLAQNRMYLVLRDLDYLFLVRFAVCFNLVIFGATIRRKNGFFSGSGTMCILLGCIFRKTRSNSVRFRGSHGPTNAWNSCRKFLWMTCAIYCC